MTQRVIVQLLSGVQLFLIPWAAAYQASFPHHLLEFAQVHIYCISDAIQPSHPLLPPSPPALNLSQHQCLFQWVGSSYQVTKVLKLQHQSFQWNSQGWFPLGSSGWISLCPRDSQESSPAPQFKSINSSVFTLLYGPTLTSVHCYWKNHSFDYTSLCWGSDISAFEYAARFVIAFLPRSMRLLISWLQLPSAGILKSKKIKSFTVSIVSPSICHKVMGPESMILVFWMFSCKPAFSLWSFP